MVGWWATVVCVRYLDLVIMVCATLFGCNVLLSSGDTQEITGVCDDDGTRKCALCRSEGIVIFRLLLPLPYSIR